MPGIPNRPARRRPRPVAPTGATEASLRAAAVSAWDEHGGSLVASGAAEEWLVAVVRLRASCAETPPEPARGRRTMR